MKTRRRDAMPLAAAAVSLLVLGAAACHKAAPEETATTAAVPVEVAVAQLGTSTLPGWPTAICTRSATGTDAVTCMRVGSTTRSTGSLAAASTMSPGLWERWATMPLNRA